MALRGYGKRSLKTLPGQLTRPTAARVREAVFNIWRDRVPGCRWLDLCAGTGSMGAEALGRGAAIAVAVEQSGRACGVIRHNWHLMARDRTTQVTVIRSAVLPFLQRWGDRPNDPASRSNSHLNSHLNSHPNSNSNSNSHPNSHPGCDQPFDLIYFDPPYACGWYDPVIQAIAHARILAPEGELAVEHNPKYWTPAAIVPGFVPCAAPPPPTAPEPTAPEPTTPEPTTPGLTALILDRQKAYGNTHLAFYRWAEG